MTHTPPLVAAKRLNTPLPLNIKIQPGANPTRTRQAFSLKEMKRILTTAPLDYEPYLTVRFYTGIRNGEIEALKWKHVDFERRRLLIRETCIKGRCLKIPVSLQRTIVMSDEVYAAFRQQWARTGNPSGWVFLNPAGNPLSLFYVTRHIWQPLIRDSGLSRRSVSQTRHTTVVLWLSAGKSPEWMAQQLGIGSMCVFFKIYFSLFLGPINQHADTLTCAVLLNNESSGNRFLKPVQSSGSVL